MRDGFSEGQTFVGIKAGDTVYAHSHLDSGSFVFDSMGTRWASDMGADSYNLPDYWDSRCRRWYVFLCCAEAHNTVVINPDEKPAYVLGSTAPVTHYEKSTDGVLVRIDTTNLYGAERGVSSSSRSYLFTDQRKSLVLRDEIKLTGKACVYWLLYTDKDAEVTESGFVLTDKQHPEKKLKVELRSSHGMTLGIEAAVAFPEGPKLEGQKTNDNYRRLYCRIDIPEGKREDLSITAKLTPFGIEATDVDEYDRPSSTWSL